MALGQWKLMHRCLTSTWRSTSRPLHYGARAIMPSGTRRSATSWYKGQLSPSSSLLSHTCPTTHPKVCRTISILVRFFYINGRAGPPPGQQGGYYPQGPPQGYDQGQYGGPPQGYAGPPQGYQPQPPPQTIIVQQQEEKSSSGCCGTCLACFAGICCFCCADALCDL
ncbi:hypothetical protein EDD85DRAFT_270246 [Armillaria nabsnona]|nr:hypothetical protein EDD85DRAFT_270246 [Armillaria nabsnona]